MPVTQHPVGRGWCRDPAGGRLGQAVPRHREIARPSSGIPAPWTEERLMSVFTVDLKNLPGELAPLCEAMAGAAST